MKIIFLDIDGVLNHSKWYTKRFEMKKELDFDRDYPKFEFCPESVSYLNEITDKTEAVIVLSSTWRLGRDEEELKQLFKDVGITGKLIGKTPRLSYGKEEAFSLGSVERGVEIKAYLEKMGYHDIFWSQEEQQKYIDKSGVENYIIIDDDSDMLYTQRNHFVHTLPFPRNDSGLNKKYRDEAIEKLNQTSVDLNFDRVTRTKLFYSMFIGGFYEVKLTRYTFTIFNKKFKIWL